MSKETMNDIANAVAKRLNAELLAPTIPALSDEQIDNKIYHAIKDAYAKCENEAEREQLYKRLSLHFHPDTIARKNAELAEFLQKKGKINAVFIKAETLRDPKADTAADPNAANEPVDPEVVVSLNNKYSKLSEADKNAQNGTFSEFFKHAFSAATLHKKLSFLNDSWFENPLQRDVKRYAFPFSLLISLISSAAILTLYIADLLRRAFVYVVQVGLLDDYHAATRAPVNLFTAGAYQKAVDNYLQSSEFRSPHLVEFKRDMMQKILDGLAKDGAKTKQQYGIAVQLDALDADAFWAFILSEAAKQGKDKIITRNFNRKMEVDIPNLIRLKLLFVAYHHALTKPFGDSNKFVAVAIIRPLQLLSALVMVPLVTFIQMMQMVVDVANFVASALINAMYYSTMALLIAPLKAYDLATNIGHYFSSKKSAENTTPKGAENRNAHEHSKGFDPLFATDRKVPAAERNAKNDANPVHYPSLFTTRLALTDKPHQVEDIAPAVSPAM